MKTELMTKQAFLNAYPTLWYGTDEEHLFVMTPDGKVCALASISFPGYESILMRFQNHELIQKPLQVKEPVTLLLAGTPLQQNVWKALLEIPKGNTVTYQDLAVKIGKPQAYRAVANAVGGNPISPLIPCHRVIRKGGALGGYYWGLEAKKKLLKAEGVVN
jgi:AraC family transcriptional regulator, regulatory protein of adaptative response / methylated-DNA-[protein]-cysteine methyltransferase